MLINVTSFQEMEPTRVQNYLNILSPKIRKIIYLNNLEEGQTLGEKQIWCFKTKDSKDISFRI